MFLWQFKISRILQKPAEPTAASFSVKIISLLDYKSIHKNSKRNKSGRKNKYFQGQIWWNFPFSLLHSFFLHRPSFKFIVTNEVFLHKHWSYRVLGLFTIRFDTINYTKSSHSGTAEAAGSSSALWEISTTWWLKALGLSIKRLWQSCYRTIHFQGDLLYISFYNIQYISPLLCVKMWEQQADTQTGLIETTSSVEWLTTL